MRRAIWIIAAVLWAGTAQAAEKMFSYEPANADARRLTGAGLTFQFKTGLTGSRIRTVMATAVPVKGIVRPAREADLKGGAPKAGTLYEIDAARDQGKVFVRAMCPGSSRLWLAVGPLDRGRDLHVDVLGDDAKGGAARTCAAMDFTFRAEWTLPSGTNPDPMSDPFDSSLKD